MSAASGVCGLLQRKCDPEVKMKSFWSGFKYKINEAVGSNKRKNKSDGVDGEQQQEPPSRQMGDDKGEVSSEITFKGAHPLISLSINQELKGRKMSTR